MSIVETRCLYDHRPYVTDVIDRPKFLKPRGIAISAAVLLPANRRQHLKLVALLNPLKIKNQYFPLKPFQGQYNWSFFTFVKYNQYDGATKCGINK